MDHELSLNYCRTQKSVYGRVTNILIVPGTNANLTVAVFYVFDRGAVRHPVSGTPVLAVIRTRLVSVKAGQNYWRPTRVGDLIFEQNV